MRKYTVGIDYGTLSGRCVLVDLQTGEEIAVSEHEYTHRVMDKTLPDGTLLQVDWSLQHPMDYLEVLETTIKDTLQMSGVNQDQVVGIGIVFTACTMLPILKDGTPMCFLDKYKSEPNAYVKLWKHHSAQYEANEINKVAQERGEQFLKRYGGKISSEWMFPKIWQTLKENPELYDDTYCFIEASDWIVMQLCKKLIRNSSSAGYKAIWNNKEGYPSKEFFAALDPNLENVINDKMKGSIYTIGTRAGELTKRGAKLTGLKEGIAVSTAHLDAVGSTVGVKITTPGKMLIMMGTSSCHMIISEKERDIQGICGVVEGGIIPGYIGYEAGQSCVGDLFQWFTENCVPKNYYDLAANEDNNIHQYLSKLAESKEPGASGLLALDWWNGNRSVLVDGKLSGVLLGCTLQTRAEDIYRALIESTAFGTRIIIDNFAENEIQIDEIVIAGGIAEKNAFIMQLYADVLGKTVKTSGSKQNAALSAAIWASLAAGKVNGGFDALVDAVAVLGKLSNLEYKPNMKHHEIYNQLYIEYKILHDYFGRGANDVMKRLKRLTEKVISKKTERS